MMYNIKLLAYHYLLYPKSRITAHLIYDDNNASKLDDVELTDFEPFVASFTKYRWDMPEKEKQAFMETSMEEPRHNKEMTNIFSLMFDFELDISEV